MKLLREIVFLRALRQLLAGRHDVARRVYTVTVPAPLVRSLVEQPSGSNVIEFHRRAAATNRASTYASTDAISAHGHLVLASNR